MRTIVQGIADPVAVALDRAGNLYVANRTANTVSVYAPGFSTPFRTIRKGVSQPATLAFSKSGNLYVGNLPSRYPHDSYGPGSVSVYGPNGSKPIRTITKGSYAPISLAFDASDRLYVASLYYATGSALKSGSIAEYARGGKTPVRFITSGVQGPYQILISASGKLYVDNHAWSYSIYTPYHNGSVAVFGSKGGKPQRTITNGLINPRSIAVDSLGTLYVASGYGDYSLTEYAAGSKTPQLTIPNINAQTLLVDAENNLYVGAYNHVYLYGPGAATPSLTYDGGAVALALGDL